MLLPDRYYMVLFRVTELPFATNGPIEKGVEIYKLHNTTDAHLQEGQNHGDQGVRAHAAGEGFVEVALGQELLKDQGQRVQARVLVDAFRHDGGSCVVSGRSWRSGRGMCGGME